MVKKSLVTTAIVLMSNLCIADCSSRKPECPSEPCPKPKVIEYRVSFSSPEPTETWRGICNVATALRNVCSVNPGCPYAVPCDMNAEATQAICTCIEMCKTCPSTECNIEVRCVEEPSRSECSFDPCKVEYRVCFTCNNPDDKDWSQVCTMTCALKDYDCGKSPCNSEQVVTEITRALCSCVKKCVECPSVECRVEVACPCDTPRCPEVTPATPCCSVR